MARTLFVFLITGGFIYVSSPLIFPLAMGGVLAVLFSPLFEAWVRKTKMSRMVASLLMTTTITFVLIIPMSLVLFFAAKAAVSGILEWSPNTQANVTSKGGFFDFFWASSQAKEVVQWISGRFPVGMEEIGAAFNELGTKLGAWITNELGGLLGQLPGIAISLGIIVISVYFFLVDGWKLVLFARRYSFFEPDQTDRLIASLSGVCRSVILAALVAGGAQAITYILACVFTGTPNGALFGLMIFVGSFLPVVGAAPVTFGVAIQQILVGRTQAGIWLLVSAFFIVFLDNLIRPLFLKGSANLHPLVAFVAAFGGLQVLGFLGVFLGPIIAALFVVTLQILTQSHRAVEGTNTK